MSSGEILPARAGAEDAFGPGAGHDVSPEDLLRDFFELQDRLDTLTETLATLATVSPVTAVLLNMGLEKARRRAGHHRLLAARAAQRSLAHELPVETLNELREITDHPAGFAAGDAVLPADPRSVPTGRLPHKNTAELLQRTCAIGYFDARDRLDAADFLLPGTDEHGMPAPARYPLLAVHLRAGKLDPTEAIRAANKLEKLRSGIAGQPNPAKLTASIEEQVLESLLTQGPAATTKLLNTVNAELEDAPAPAPTGEELAAKTGFRLSRRTEHLTYFTLTVTNLDAELVLSHFALSDNPRTNAGNRENLANDAQHRNSGTQNNGNGEGAGSAPGTNVVPLRPMDRNEAPTIPEWAVAPNTPPNELPHAEWTDLGRTTPAHRADGSEDFVPPSESQASAVPTSEATLPDRFNNTAEGPDGLTPARRRLQTLLNIMRTSGAPRSKGSKATSGLPQARLIVYCQLTTLLGLAEKAGITQHGLTVSPGDLRRELCNAGVIPLVFNGESQILDVGREQRFVPDYMRQAVLARDGGCIVPGCTVPPEHLEMCHIDSWADGGNTSIDNSAPGCVNHHHGYHTGQYRLVRNEHGLPAVILPKYLDPEQKPRRSTQWQQHTQSGPNLF
ncbi:HNH endonuclease signature motif containing protein [Paeniglutamicibacter sp. NPDC012692]|uniref:HNH endonuclease signature motif containing protein n=1 Tax=Paeniglutamicibacter sp. NPDC012692 TaxID=3364388 RepID=UPI003697B236